ncbi:Hypothetical predicted protein [Lecanosticta acicola]|uniref:Uncharacterized protein n=1 Tax=Lecanosticta acicola TaxID=111012 RepID=A0AAI9E819_9PEZI|nr:Hypothetical predicted protein [Lecanosticta acicola]
MTGIGLIATLLGLLLVTRSVHAAFVPKALARRGLDHPSVYARLYEFTEMVSAASELPMNERNAGQVDWDTVSAEFESVEEERRKKGDGEEKHSSSDWEQVGTGPRG